MPNFTAPAYQVRTITDGGDLVDLTAFDYEDDARLSFDAWVPNLDPAFSRILQGVQNLVADFVRIKRVKFDVNAVLGILNILQQ